MKHLIFDCDGVIVDSEIEAAKALVSTFSDLGIAISIDYHLKHHSGRTFKDIFDDLIKQNIINPQTDINALIQKVETKSYANIKPISGIFDTVNSISLPKAVVSNGGISQIQHALKIARVTDQFNGNIFSSAMVNRPKPSPEIYLFASNRLNVSPSDCLVIEDSISGVSAAVAAGMTVFAFTGASHILKGHEERVIGIGATKTFNNMEQLPKLIEDFVRI